MMTAFIIGVLLIVVAMPARPSSLAGPSEATRAERARRKSEERFHFMVRERSLS